MNRIYCAGPLFNPKEREEMSDIATSLESGGYGCFLPQRDGIELANIKQKLVAAGASENLIDDVLKKAIFHIDTYQVVHCDGLILNMNGRVPDEGAMVEAGIAWSKNKPIVIYKNDSRSPLLGLDNPLVVGLSRFRIVGDILDIPKEFDLLFGCKEQEQAIFHKDWTDRSFRRGEQLQRIFSKHKINKININRLAKVLEE